MIRPARASTHELDGRSSDGLHVRLVWLTPDDRLFVTVTDSKHDQRSCVEVHDRRRALDVFHHPFAYASHLRSADQSDWSALPVTEWASA